MVGWLLFAHTQKMLRGNFLGLFLKCGLTAAFACLQSHQIILEKSLSSDSRPSFLSRNVAFVTQYNLVPLHVRA